MRRRRLDLTNAVGNSKPCNQEISRALTLAEIHVKSCKFLRCFILLPVSEEREEAA